MNSTVLKNIYDKLYFEQSTDMVFLTSELSSGISASVEAAKLRIVRLDEKIADFEKLLFSLSPEEQENWSNEINELKFRRTVLISKIYEEIKSQTQIIQSWAIDFESLMEDNHVTER